MSSELVPIFNAAGIHFVTGIVPLNLFQRIDYDPVLGDLYFIPAPGLLDAIYASPAKDGLAEAIDDYTFGSMIRLGEEEQFIVEDDVDLDYLSNIYIAKPNV